MDIFSHLTLFPKSTHAVIFQITSWSSLWTLSEFSPSSDRASEISESRPAIDLGIRGGRRALYQRTSQPDINLFGTFVVSLKFFLPKILYLENLFTVYPATFPPPPHLYGSRTFTYLEENFSMAKLPCLLYVKKQRKNLYGKGITCITTIPKPPV
jgi:hypothetical protein